MAVSSYQQLCCNMNNVNITYLEKIIHEMNNPLQNLILIPDLMLDSNINMSEVDRQENLDYLRNSAERLAQLVRMLSAVTNLKYEKIKLNFIDNDLIGLINKEINYHAIRIKKNKNTQVKLTLDTRLNSFWIKIDSFWFSQLLANLIVNAINHTDKGKIEIKLDTFSKDDNEYIQLKVTDDGCGIPEDELEEIFHPLKRCEHSVGRVKGSGIGLAVVKEIVEGHQGSVKATNNESGGATFEVAMPVERKLSLFKR